MNKKNSNKNLWEDVPDTVYSISQLNFIGNVIPHTWWNHIKHAPDAKGVERPNTNAIVILADICYWYRPTVVRDESTGKILAYKKKFKGKRLQKSYSGIAKQFGFTKKQARDAINFLEQKGLIKKIVEDIVETDYGDVLSNVLYLEPIVEKISEITFDKQEKEIIDLQIDKHNSDLPNEGGVTSRSEGGMTYKSQGVTSKSEGCDLEVGRVCPPGHTYTKITTDINNSSSNKAESAKMSELKQSESEQHIKTVKEWFESTGIQGIFDSDLKPLWKRLYPKLDIEQEVEKAYSNLLTHPSSLKNYLPYFQACIYNAAIGRFPQAKNQDSRLDECLQWYISNHPFGYSFNSEEDERSYIARVLAFIDQYPGKKKKSLESFQRLCEQYWKLDTSVNQKFEYLEKSNWRLRHLPDAINYIIALNRGQKAKTKAKAEYLVDLAPTKPGRYFARNGSNGVFEVDVYLEDGRLVTKHGPVDELEWQWSIAAIDSS